MEINEARIGALEERTHLLEERAATQAVELQVLKSVLLTFIASTPNRDALLEPLSEAAQEALAEIEESAFRAGHPPDLAADARHRMLGEFADWVAAIHAGRRTWR